MKLPKLYRVVTIRFWSLRLGLGWSGGVEEFDKQVTRKARRVLYDKGWKWQLIDDEGLYDHIIDDDKTCLDEHELNEVEILNNPYN